MVNLKQCSLLRKEKLDEKSKIREFKKGYRVLMRKRGMNTKLSESWLGPFEVVKKNSSLSYKVNTRSKVINSVHIQLLKEYVTRDSALVIRRVTTVLEPDTESDSMDQEYAKVIIRGKAESSNRESDIQEWLGEF